MARGYRRVRSTIMRPTVQEVRSIQRRSTSHHLPQIEIPQYSSLGVREQTQELASWALGESSSVRTAGHHASASDSMLDGRTPPLSVLSDSEHGDTRDSTDSPRPDITSDVIEEVAEPVTPERDDPAVQSGQASGLSNLIKDNQAQGRDEESIGVGSYSEFDQRSSPSVFIDDVETNEATEASPLLPRERLPGRSYSSTPKAGDYATPRNIHLKGWWTKIKYEYRSMTYVVSHPQDWNIQEMGRNGMGAVTAVFLGLLLNILDALSYGGSADFVFASLKANRIPPRYDSLPSWGADLRKDRP
jgi:SulP family sulfate permease